jgi:transposase
MRSWLPPGHLTWQVAGAVGELDLSGFAAAYRADGQGQAPYDPAMMLALVLYCYVKGIRSSRKIAAACIDDVGCRVICGGAAPGHQAFAQFVRRHRAEVVRLFVQVLGLLAAAGAIEGHCAAVDGSPVSGNASRFANLDAEQLEARITALQAAIGAAAQAWLDGADEADGAGSQQLPWDDDDDDGGPGGGGPGGGVPRRLAAMAATLARLHAAQDKLAARRQAASPRSPDARITAARGAVSNAGRRLAQAGQAQAAVMEKYQAAVAAGKPWAGTKPVPAAENVRIARIRKNLATASSRLAAAEAAAAAGPAKVPATGPDSRLLPAKNGGGYPRGWNLELAAARRQVLLAIELHDNPAGCGALATMIEAAAANCELTGVREQIRAWLAGNGYASTANFQALEHLMLLVATTGEATQTGRAAGGRALPAGWEKMAARLATPAGKKLYKRRAGLAEPAFAQLFARFGRYVSYRGRPAADAEVKLPGAVRNLAKLFEYRRRHPAAAPA